MTFRTDFTPIFLKDFMVKTAWMHVHRILKLTLARRSLSACLAAFSLSPPAVSQACLASALDKGTQVFWDSLWCTAVVWRGLGLCWNDAAMAQISSSLWGNSVFTQSHGGPLMPPETRRLVYTSSGLTPFPSASWGKKRFERMNKKTPTTMLCY